MASLPQLGPTKSSPLPACLSFFLFKLYTFSVDMVSSCTRVASNDRKEGVMKQHVLSCHYPNRVLHLFFWPESAESHLPRSSGRFFGSAEAHGSQVAANRRTGAGIEPGLERGGERPGAERLAQVVQIGGLRFGFGFGCQLFP